MVVVGPNGSGKSNLVDAVAVGARRPGPAHPARRQDGRRHLRRHPRPPGARPGRGVAHDRQLLGLLPIEFTEVTITRTLFRNGDSEYAINGAPCRLLDIQELLSDTGIGRQQHVIVGQGQLDAVLNSRPEDRRAVIEEAAGVLKYRKRRERAERRLESTEGNLLRLNDLLREVRRGLAPAAEAGRRRPPSRRSGRGAPVDPAAPRRPRAGGPPGQDRAAARPGDRAGRAAKRWSRPGCASSTSRCSTPSAP